MTDDECRRIELEAYAHLIRCSRDDFAFACYTCGHAIVNALTPTLKRLGGKLK